MTKRTRGQFTRIVPLVELDADARIAWPTVPADPARLYCQNCANCYEMQGGALLVADSQVIVKAERIEVCPLCGHEHTAGTIMRVCR